jgi:hypothetical protein
MSLNEGTLTYAQQVERYKASKDRIYKAAVPQKPEPPPPPAKPANPAITAAELAWMRRTIDDLVKEVSRLRQEVASLSQSTPCPDHIRTVRGLISLTSEIAGLVPNDVCSPRRAYSRARHIAMFLARRFTNASLPEIGRVFGGVFGSMDHSSVWYGITRVEMVAAKIGEPTDDTPEAWAQHLLTNKWPRVDPKRRGRNTP